MVSQCAKYEVSRFTRYKAVNGGAKCRKWDGLFCQIILDVNSIPKKTVQSDHR